MSRKNDKRHTFAFRLARFVFHIGFGLLEAVVKLLFALAVFGYIMYLIAT